MSAAAVALLAVRVGVLGIFAPTHVEVTAGPAHHDVRLAGAELLVDGQRRPSLRVEGRPLVEVRVLRDAPGRGGDKAGRDPARITRRFHGAVEIRPAASALRLINELDDEQYLLGTIAPEAGSTHPTALAAQAVVARTFVARGARHGAEGFDVCDLTHCQTYKGVEGETDPARRAVESTRGEVVRAGGRIADVYFTSSCGGATADADDVWPGGGRTWLRSVPCEVCARAAPRWRTEIPLGDVDRALASGGQLTGLTVLATGAGGTVRLVRLEGDGRVLSGEAVRMAIGRALGWSKVLGNRFSVELLGEGRSRRLRFTGTGHGHGVGLCTTGAASLAARGLDYRAILKRYFTGVEVGQRPR